MGNWNINIQGVGCHHNPGDNEKDANKMAAKFTEELVKAGHTIEGATFTHGGKEELPQTMPTKYELKQKLWQAEQELSSLRPGPATT